METLKIKSSAFAEGAWIPKRYTARGDNLSPDFEIEGIDPMQNPLQLPSTMHRTLFFRTITTG